MKKVITAFLIILHFVFSWIFFVIGVLGISTGIILLITPAEVAWNEIVACFSGSAVSLLILQLIGGDIVIKQTMDQCAPKKYY